MLLEGLGFDASGKLYGLGDDGNLYGVNASTAALSLIGAYTGNFDGGVAFGSGSNGTLYATNGRGDIWSVNSSSGAATLIGNMGLSTNSNPSGAVGSNLYLTSGNSLYSVNPTTAAATLVGAGSYSYVFNLVFTNNTMYAIDDFYFGTRIYFLNLTNGQSTLLSNYNESVIGGIVGVAAVNAVPEPTSLVLGGIASAVAGLAWVRRHRESRRGRSRMPRT